MSLRPRGSRPHASAPFRGWSRGRVLIAAVAACLAFTGLAVAATTGVQNQSFESGLDGWTASVLRTGETSPVATSCATPEGV